VRASQAYSTLIPLTLALSREERGKRIKVKGVNAFVLILREILLRLTINEKA
jgi:hypothetical protein